MFNLFILFKLAYALSLTAIVKLSRLSIGLSENQRTGMKVEERERERSTSAQILHTSLMVYL